MLAAPTRTLAPVGLFVALFLVAACTRGERAAHGAFGTGRVVIHAARGEVTVEVEIAETEATRQVGLSGRRSLHADAGMAFLFERPTTGSFWMRDTSIPLSIAFWSSDRRIVAILDMDPCRRDPCPLYSPGRAYIGALEVNRGFFERHGVRAGDLIEISR